MGQSRVSDNPKELRLAVISIHITRAQCNQAISVAITLAWLVRHAGTLHIKIVTRAAGVTEAKGVSD